MAQPIVKVHLVGLLLICFYASLSQCQTKTLDTATSIEDYIENTSAHYKNEIQILETQITQMELAVAKEISIVAFSEDLAAKLARQVESRLRSTGTLNMQGKLCIQNFIGNVTAENHALQVRLRACSDAARNSVKALPDTAKTHVRNARQQLVDLMKTDLTVCRTSNGNNEQKLIACAQQKLKIRETNIRSYLTAGGRDIEGALCRADIFAKTAQECSFNHLLNSQTLIAEILANVNTCIGDRIVEIRN